MNRSVNWEPTLRVFSILLILLCSKAQASYVQPNDSSNTVRLQLKWKHQFQFAGYYAALEQGFYQDAGMLVELLEAKQGSEPGNAVFDGRAQFGVGSSDAVLMRASGKDIVVLANIFQHSPYAIVALKDSGVNHVQDLLGKKIMLEPHAAELIAYMQDEGVPLGKCDVHAHDFSVNGLLNGQVDAMSVYITDEPFALEQAGLSYNLISPLAGGIDFYGDNLFTSEKFLNKNPELVERFREASLKGWRYALDHTDEMVELIYNKYSQRHSKAHLLYEAQQMKRLIMDNVVEIGYTNAGRWKGIVANYHKVRLLPFPIPIKGMLYDDHMAKDRQIPWDYVVISMLLLVAISFTARFYYTTSKKLTKQVHERKMAQEAMANYSTELAELNTTKDKFLTIIAHDLRNPFNAIMGYASLLIENYGNQDPKVSMSHLSIIKQTSAQAYSLLENLLVWAKSQLGTIEFNTTEVDLWQLIDENIKLVESMAKRKNIEIITHPDVGFTVMGDANMLNTVVRNLLTNAIKFTYPGGTVTVSIRAQVLAYELRITDTGIGIPEQELDQLFKLGERSNSSGTQKEVGSGLGLVLVKEFVNYHNGKIWAESIYGKGSTFVVWLPTEQP